MLQFSQQLLTMNITAMVQTVTHAVPYGCVLIRKYYVHKIIFIRSRALPQDYECTMDQELHTVTASCENDCLHHL